MKARIKNLEAYLQEITECTNAFVEMYYNTFHGQWNDTSVEKINQAFTDLFSNWYGEGYSLRESSVNKIRYCNQYIEKNCFYWDVIVCINGYAVLHYGKTDFLIREEYLEYKAELDYSQIPLSALRSSISDNISMLPTELTDKALIDVKKESTMLNEHLQQLKDEEKNIRDAKTRELKKMQEQIDFLIAEMNQKKEVLMQQLREKQEALKRQKKELEAQIYMLQTEIYSIRCYMGETVELIGIRDGESAGIEEPMVLNQKILYLDEDLARMMSLYGYRLDDYKLLEEAIKFNDEVFESFCPQKKCITFFRVSRKNEISYFNDKMDCLDSYAMLHGKKIGFAVRNGEKLYLGWLEEEWEPERTLTFDENVILHAGKTEVTPGDTAVSTPLGERVSRMFALNVLRGLLNNRKIVELPDGEDLLKPSKYVIHNYADVWLDDNRYGDFAALVRNLHYYDREKDVILLICSLSESWSSHKNGTVRGLEEAQVNRTHDCSVRSGINRINMIDEKGNIYVSAVKEYSAYGARSNFLIHKREFMNLTFMNSLWLKYYIMTKKIGNFGEKLDQFGRRTCLDYAYMIPYFKQALEYLVLREEEEAALIGKYVNLNEHLEWQVKLSHWKIIKNVHQITDYQARRFVKYLQSNEYFEVAHLFDNLPKWVKPDLHGSYSATQVEGSTSCYVRWMNSTGENHPLYGYGGTYEKEKFSEKSTKKEVDDRVELDRKKLLCIKEEVDNWLQNQDISINEICKIFQSHVKMEKERDERDRGNWFPDVRRVYRKNTCRDILILDFLEHYGVWEPRKFAKSEYLCGYLSMEKETFEKLLPLHYYKFLQYEVFDTILEVATQILTSRWYHEIKLV